MGSDKKRSFQTERLGTHASDLMLIMYEIDPTCTLNAPSEDITQLVFGIIDIKDL